MQWGDPLNTVGKNGDYISQKTSLEQQDNKESFTSEALFSVKEQKNLIRNVKETSEHDQAQEFFRIMCKFSLILCSHKL